MGITAEATGVKKRSEKGRKMTREDVLKLFPTATEEAISSMLNLHHTELNTEKAKAKPNAEDKEKIKELTEQLEILQNKDLTESEQLQKEITELKKKNEEATKQIKNMELKNKLLGKGFGEDDVNTYIEAINGDGDIAEVLGKMKENIISAHDKERMDNTPDPSGNAGNNPDDAAKKTEELAKQIAGSISGETKTSADIVNAYA